MRSAYRFLLIYLFCSLFCFVQANKKVDSLITVSKTFSKDSSLVDLYHSISWALKYSSPDSSIIFANKGLELAEKLGYQDGIAKCLNNIGVANDVIGNYDQAIKYHRKSLNIRLASKNLKGISVSLINLGVIYQKKGAFKKAILFYLLSSRIKENLGDTKGIASCYINIGIVYYYMNEVEKSLKYFNDALNTHDYSNDKKMLTLIISNIASIYAGLEEYGISNNYYLEVIPLFKEQQDLYSLSDCYAGIGSNYKELKQYDLAIEYLFKAMVEKEKLDDKRGLAFTYNFLASTYILKAIESKKNIVPENINRSILYSKKALDIAESLSLLQQKKDALKTLYQIYDIKDNYKEAYNYYKEYVILKDSLLNNETKTQIAELETKYQSDKRIIQIENLEKEKELQAEIIQKKEDINKSQRLWIFLSLIAMFIILTFAIISYRLYLGKKKYSELLILHNEKIVTQKEEIENQKDTMIHHRGEIEFQNKHITQSIKYAKRIQNAILPEITPLKDFFKDFFIIDYPKEIVSGDFYYVDKKNEKIFIAVVDCTGHGVPGAFMSIIGANILKTAIHEHNLTCPAEILNLLSKEIRDAFSSPYKSGIKDGMDLTLVTFDINTKTIEIAGVRNPMYIFTKNNISIFKPDSMPIGEPFNEDFNSYKTQTYQLQSNDRIYLFTDGFHDQLGGKYKRKFMLGRFRNLLCEIQEKSMPQQKEILEEKFDKWKGINEQYDDILVLGITIS